MPGSWWNSAGLLKIWPGRVWNLKNYVSTNNWSWSSWSREKECVLIGVTIFPAVFVLLEDTQCLFQHYRGRRSRWYHKYLFVNVTSRRTINTTARQRRTNDTSSFSRTFQFQVFSESSYKKVLAISLWTATSITQLYAVQSIPDAPPNANTDDQESTKQWLSHRRGRREPNHGDFCWPGWVATSNVTHRQIRNQCKSIIIGVMWFIFLWRQIQTRNKFWDSINWPSDSRSLAFLRDFSYLRLYSCLCPHHNEKTLSPNV